MYIVNGSGQEVAAYSYDPYGNVITATGTLAEVNPLRYRGYYYDSETGFYYLQSRYYDPEIGRFINADVFPSTGQGIIGNNMFAYCGNNPVCRTDSTGLLWGTIITIGIGTIASVVTSAISAAISGEEFTVGDAVGAAIEGAAATTMAILGIPLFLANPLATFCGGVIGKYIDGDTSKEASYEILEDTGKTFVTTLAFSGAGKVMSKYADVYLSGKYKELNVADKFIKEMVYQPKYLDKSSVHTVISDSFWDSARTLAVDMVW